MASRARHRLLYDTVSVGRFASEDLVVDNYSIAIGRKAGNNGPIGEYAIAIGDQAGENNQSTYSIAIGPQAGQFTQGTHAIAIGDKAGKTTQGINAIAIGDQAGNSTQGIKSIAIGDQAGNSAQGARAIAIGDQAGNSTQGIKSIAIGDQAGNSAQGARAIAIGQNAGKGILEVTATASSQTELPNQIDEYNTDAPPITKHIMVLDTTANIVAGMKIKETSQVVNTVVNATTIELDVSGTQTGTLTFSGFQGASAIAIGAQASVTAQLANTIVINATDTPLHVNKKGSLYIAPVRAVAKNANIVTYDSVTKEMATAFPKMPVYDTDDKATKDMTASNVDKTQNGWMYFDKTKKKMKIWIDSKWLAIADEKDLAASKAVAAAAAIAGQSGTVAGSGSGSAQAVTGAAFVTGGGASATTPQYVVDPVTGETRLAVSGVDFYWEDVRPEGGEQYYAPVFYNTLTVVGNTTEHTNNNPNLGGYNITTYSNGHQVLTPIPMSDYNPALAQYNNLELQSRRELLNEYGTQAGVYFFVSPTTAEDPWTDKGSYESQQFQDFLKSKGFG